MAEGGKKTEKKTKSKKKSLPGPISVPGMGSVMSLTDLPFHEDLVRLGKKYGSIFRLYISGRYYII